MKFSFHIPIDHVEPPGEFQSPEAVREIAAALERAGADAVHLTEHPAPLAEWLHNDPAGHDALDPFAGLAFVAAVTTRVKLHTNIVVLPYRNPFLTAKSAATLQVLSGGRLILGVGAGYQRAEFDALGVNMKERGALMDEALETIRLAWKGGPVVKEGRHFKAIGNEPRPVPDPPPPIWIGGGSDKAVERAARFGDGWVPFFSVPTNDLNARASSVSSIAELGQKIARLKEMRAGMGRTGPFEICSGAPLHVRPDSPEDLPAYGDALHELEEIGVDWVRVALPARSRAEYLDKVAWFGEEVMRKFRQQPKCAAGD